MRVYLLVLAVAAACTYLAVPIVRHIALMANAMAPVRSRDVHKAPIPRLGGVAMFLGFATAIAVADNIPFLESVIGRSAWAVVAGAGLVCALGVVDDLWELDWMTKLVGQVLAAGIMAWQGVQLITFPVGGVTIGSSRLSLISTVLVVVAVINAVNFVDGLDGLAAGLIGIGAVAFFLYTYVLTRQLSAGSYASLAATVVAALIGVCVGFLPHNYHPASIFMGDSGSMQLGLISAAGTIIVTGQIDPGALGGSRALPVFLPVLLPFAVLLLPLTDMTMAVFRRMGKGLSPFHPDRMHMHHRLLDAGHSHRRAVLTMYIWAAAVSFPVAAMAFFPTDKVLIGFVVALALALLATLDLMPGVRVAVSRHTGGVERHRASKRTERKQDSAQVPGDQDD
ncbi:Undecaprenyl-phosphate alpha-N-acetylglucosaminyl 1-phosphate transferase [Actinomyces bovis]|uniref:Undecaprenyl-phosphate alpha-N-acetylglucosaminyl 1-phosphate transferase n=1 Tax=Actinomyces bovis TaxID=1658 RepID=A0ABY1VL34_9ACTO|nr:MraY family glycosyltransferase [Actinomyces bovis]SPT52803.1 Undecaprenyl-phosphate alpha-N-acetylglucosaminyl 1-phosphate transferase [Actinomyces bovis]VEG54844.1 Undecaprenyl-phosphate alpha-N-acetylglucosaminyl 1-phosphate transferase [Actinomyces israelii]